MWLELSVLDERTGWVGGHDGRAYRLGEKAPPPDASARRTEAELEAWASELAVATEEARRLDPR